MPEAGSMGALPGLFYDLYEREISLIVIMSYKDLGVSVRILLLLDGSVLMAKPRERDTEEVH
jgi:hypothetical protein